MALTPDVAIRRANRELPQLENRLYMVLCIYRSKSTGTCYPSLKTLARDLNTDSSNVSKARRGLIDKGFISIQGKGPNGHLLIRLIVGFSEGDLSQQQPRDLSQQQGGGSVAATMGICCSNHGINRNEPAHEPEKKNTVVSEFSSCARGAPETTTYSQGFSESKPEPVPKPKLLPVSRSGPMVLTESDMPALLAELERQNPGINVFHVRDKLARAGGEQTKFRLTRWCAMEHRSAQLPELKRESSEEYYDRIVEKWAALEAAGNERPRGQ